MIQEDGGRDPAAGPRPPAFTSRTAPFRRRVRECLAPALVAVAPDISIEIAVRRMTAAETSGYEIDEAEVIYWGRCPECVSSNRQQLGAT